MKHIVRKTCGLASLLALGVAAAQAEAASCSYSVVNQWNTGFQGSITITNNTSSTINGWNLGWAYSKNKITSSWNANLGGSNPYTASNLSWNATIQPGQSVSFGVQGDLNGGAAETPVITGNVCGSAASSSVVSSSSKSSVASSVVSSVVSSKASSVASSVNSSKASSSSSSNGGFTQQCNWYGSLYPVCVTTTSGWGYELGQSCISVSTCTSQPAPYGIVGASSSSKSSVVSSSSKSSVASSVASSVVSSVVSSVPVSSSSVASSVVSSSSSSKPASSSSSSSVVSSSSSSSSVTPGVRLDNPFVGATWYVNPEWQARAMSEPGGSKVANNNTAVWMDRIAAIQGSGGGMGLRAHLKAALDQKANLITVVIYDLPNRDCHALASNGELVQGPEGTKRYRNEYIDPIASIFADPLYKDIRIIAIIEPDSLPNLVTNLTDPECAQATSPTDGYVPNTQYTLNKLYPISNVYSYVDIGHSGWLGWESNLKLSAEFVANTIKGTTAGVNSVAGFVSNTSGYTPLAEPFLDAYSAASMPGNPGTQVRQAKFYEWNYNFSELSFVKAWRTIMIANGFPTSIGMLVDTSRNGWGGANRPKALSTSSDLETFVNTSRIDLRAHRGNWCNQRGGIGERPKAVNADGIDAYVWVKPPGESDGAASKELSFDPNDPSKGFDRMCDPTYVRSEGSGSVVSGAMPEAPVAGQWFSAGFQQLLKDAYPPLQ